MSVQSLDNLVDPGWAKALAPVTDTIRELGDKLRKHQESGNIFLPTGANILRAFTYPFEQAKVIIVGQDPYPTPGHPIGISFAVNKEVHPLPRSLVNIYTEISNDLGCPPPKHGDLSSWCQQGVVLLNRVITVTPGEAGSHRGWGWERVTECAISALAARDRPLVAILWGRPAQEVEPLLQGYPCIKSPHPSPLSASRGFFGSRPFSRANEYLRSQGATEVDWQIS